MKREYRVIEPRLSSKELGAFGAFFRRVCREISKEATAEQRSELIRRFQEEIQLETTGPIGSEKLAGAFAKSAILDLVGSAWRIRVAKGVVEIAPPRKVAGGQNELKAAVRRSHQLAREGQLLEPSVRAFVKGMERRRLTTTGWHSIFSVMRDGRELSSRLEEIVDGEPNETLDGLKETIAPYLQLVTEEGVCRHTGLLLQDVWRYFRHTWVNSYKTLPGRTMSLLIRDAATPNHAVIGIAALGSSVAQQHLRDQWIGWDQQTMVETIRKNPKAKYARWLLASLQSLIDDLYLDDLVSDGVCELPELEKPTDSGISKLEAEAESAIRAHRKFPHSAAHKVAMSNNGGVDWQAQAQTKLFRSKRCKTLAKLLRMRLTFQFHGFHAPSSAELRQAMGKTPMRNAVGQLVRNVKARHVGIDMMDIVVCGAVAPYNALLGGKLICMLLCSPEIVSMYRNRYGNQTSVIASAMKGAAEVRKPQLAFLGTTSLYGVGSSQYNRVRIPCERVGGHAGEQVTYKALGKSEGYGSYHFGALTVSLGNTMLARNEDGRRVNSIFGEGVNPRMRKLREAFEIVKLPADDILQHRNSRVVYGLALTRNFSEVLLGLNARAQYLIPQSAPLRRTGEIAEYWRERWLAMRINRPGILDEVGKHTLAYPVTHGARVILPKPTSEQFDFEDYLGGSTAEP